MKFLADEGFPRPIVNRIRILGHSVKTIQQKSLQGISDQSVAELAFKEKRILLTFDKDFTKNSYPKILIVLFNFPRTPVMEIIPFIDSFLKTIIKYQKSRGVVLRFSKSGLNKIPPLRSG